MVSCITISGVPVFIILLIHPSGLRSSRLYCQVPLIEFHNGAFKDSLVIISVYYIKRQNSIESIESGSVCTWVFVPVFSVFWFLDTGLFCYVS